MLLLPGIFIASLIAAVFFIPVWFITKKVKGDLETYGGKHWQLLTLATILKNGGFISPITGAIGYVQLLRYFLE